MKRRLHTFVFVWFTALALALVMADPSRAGMDIMSDDELAMMDGQFSTITIDSFYQQNDTVRIFMDLHQELYGTIDSVRAGYYYRPASNMRTNMASIGLSGFTDFYDVQKYAGDLNDGAYFNFAKIESNFNTLAPQGSDTFEPWGNGGYQGDLASLTPNCNYYDWDIWIDNFRFGESPDKPVYMNGQIIRLEFDGDVVNGNPHLKRLIVGTNDQQGNIYANYHRYTGIVNPMLTAHTAARSLGVADPYEYTVGTMQMVRDSYIQCFGINVFNVEDRDTGFWMVMNFQGDHVGFELISGLPENAIDFSYTEGLKSIPLWDPDWSPVAAFDGPMRDPYATQTNTQANSHEHGPTTSGGN